MVIMRPEQQERFAEMFVSGRDPETGQLVPFLRMGPTGGEEYRSYVLSSQPEYVNTYPETSRHIGAKIGKLAARTVKLAGHVAPEDVNELIDAAAERVENELHEENPDISLPPRPYVAEHSG